VADALKRLVALGVESRVALLDPRHSAFTLPDFNSVGFAEPLSFIHGGQIILRRVGADDYGNFQLIQKPKFKLLHAHLHQLRAGARTAFEDLSRKSLNRQRPN
jgi:hypothetical protein